MRPDLFPGADEYLNAFWELSTDRPIGMAAGAIPFTSIDRYAARFGVDDPDEFQSLLRAIRACDGAWLDYQRSKQEGGN